MVQRLVAEEIEAMVEEQPGSPGSSRVWELLLGGKVFVDWGIRIKRFQGCVCVCVCGFAVFRS